MVSYQKVKFIATLINGKLSPSSRYLPVSMFLRSHSSRTDRQGCSSPKRTVLISESESVYDNLALEEWIYCHEDLSKNEYLLLWKDKPAIVFGRHQNPWIEANICAARELGVDIARRSSGGGTVYHDKGNLNLSFLKSRKCYNRRENLDLVVSAIKSCQDIDLTVNCRDDIILNSFYKVSGTAAKLGRVESYHHFTLLHSVDLDRLGSLLKCGMLGTESKATKSVSASVMNLVDQAPNLTLDHMMEVIGQHFLGKKDCDRVQLVDPSSESEFPGVKVISSRLRSWPWIYGKTPKFSLSRTFSGHTWEDQPASLTVNAVVEKGEIVALTLETKTESLQGLMLLVNRFYSEHLVGESLTVQTIWKTEEKFVRFISNIFTDKSTAIYSGTKWISDCVCLSFDFL